MTKEQIQTAYEIGEQYRELVLPPDYNHDLKYRDFIQIGMQVALNGGEVLFNEDGTIKRID